MKYIVNVSGGLTSYEALRRCIAAHGPKETIAVFADTLIEDADLYRFLDDQEQHFGITIIRLIEGRTPFQVMRDERAITMQSAAPCSKILKRKLIDQWIKQNVTTEYTRVFGLDWGELHRIERLRKVLAPVQLWCPLAEKPYVTKADILRQLGEVGIKPPRLYALGFHHNNCGGGCVKAGQAHWAHVLQVLPDLYEKWEQEEEGIREHLGKNVAILKEQRNGISRPVTLRQFRTRIEAGQPIDSLWGGCGCFLE